MSTTDQLQQNENHGCACQRRGSQPAWTDPEIDGRCRRCGEWPNWGTGRDDAHHSIGQMDQGVLHVGAIEDCPVCSLYLPPDGDAERDEDARIDAAVAAAEMDRRAFLDDPERRS